MNYESKEHIGTHLLMHELISFIPTLFEIDRQMNVRILKVYIFKTITHIVVSYA